MKTLAILLAAITTGCSTTTPKQAYLIKGRMILVECVDQMDLHRDPTAQQHNACGYNQTVGNITKILVPWSGKYDINGKPLPDFETLGHELWHCPELGGFGFHK